MSLLPVFCVFSLIVPSLLYVPTFLFSQVEIQLIIWYVSLSTVYLFTIPAIRSVHSYGIRITYFIGMLLWSIGMIIPNFIPVLTLICYGGVVPIASSMLIWTTLMQLPWNFLTMTTGSIIGSVIFGFVFVQVEGQQDVQYTALGGFFMLFCSTFFLPTDISRVHKGIPWVRLRMFMRYANLHIWLVSSSLYAPMSILYLPLVRKVENYGYMLFGLGVTLGILYSSLARYTFEKNYRHSMLLLPLITTIDYFVVDEAWTVAWVVLYGFSLGAWWTARETIWNIYWSTSRHLMGRALSNTAVGVTTFVSLPLVLYIKEENTLRLIGIFTSMIAWVISMCIIHVQEEIPVAMTPLTTSQL